MIDPATGGTKKLEMPNVRRDDQVWAEVELPADVDWQQEALRRANVKKDGEIDWNQPAIDIWRQVRAFQPWPGCYTGWQGKQLKIIEAVPVIEQSPVKPGTVVETAKEGTAVGVNTGDGILGILQVQLEGKKAMTAAPAV